VCFKKSKNQKENQQMKKFIKNHFALLLVLFLLAASLIPGGAILSASMGIDESLDFNLFEVAGEISETFVSETTELIRDNWEENYFSAITMKLGEAEMFVDGSKEAVSSPAVKEKGKIMLPIVDIAYAVGATVDVDETGESITIENDGETTIIDTPIDNDVLSAAAKKVNKVSDDDVKVMPMRDGRAIAESPLLPVSELEEALALDILIDGEDIIISKPYQLKQIIVYVKDGQELEDSYEAEQYTSNGHGLYFLQYSSESLTQAAYEAFQASADIAYAALNKVVKTAALPDRWGSERIAADRFKTYLHDNGKATTPLTVAVLDTGVDVSHPHLSGRTTAGYNFIDSNNNPYDVHSHGTHVSGTIADCSTSNVKIMPVKVLNDSGKGTDANISLGIRYAADNGAAVINMSLGGSCYDNNCPIKQAVDYAISKGVTSVASAGNNASDVSLFCPAKLSTVITVSAFTIRDLPASFTNTGAAIDIGAPGVDILSSVPGGGYRYMSGTSMAAPHVSAAVAMHKLDNMSATPAQLKIAVQNSTVTAWGLSPIFYGAGLLDLDAHFGPVPTESAGIKLSRHFLDIQTMPDKYQLYQLSARVMPLSAPNQNVTYSSNNPAVAACDSSGLVEIKGNGTATITVTSLGNGHTDTCLVTVNVNESQFWIGSAASSFAGGDGSAGNPYKIATPEQLALLARNSRLLIAGGGLYSSEYFELTNDIDLAGKEWVSIGWNDGDPSITYSAYFLGHLNGNGHIIKNMSQGNAFSGLGCAEHGLFEWFAGEVRDLGIVDADQKGSPLYPSYKGILARMAGGGETVIENCFTTGQTVGRGFVYEINPYYGATVYDVPVIKNCYSTAKSATHEFTNYIARSIVSNCYAYGDYTYLCYEVYNSTIANSFVASTGSTNLFTLVKSNSTISKCYASGNTYLILLSDDNPLTTDITAKPISFFKDINSYTTTANWNSTYSWDFNNVWQIDENFNDGLPYLKGFHNYPPPVITTVSAGGVHATALKSDGTLWAWGSNVAGQLGDGTTIDHHTPIKIGADCDWKAVAAGNAHTMALKNDGSLWAWGANSNGMLGDGTNTQRNIPVQVGIYKDWIAVAVGAEHTIALKSNGSLWAWGTNNYGQIGDYTITSCNTPIQIGTDYDWKAVAAGTWHTMALKSDGSLWAWGLNISGQLGDGTTTDCYAPVRIGTDNDWAMVAAGTYHTIALKSNGSLWAWGQNYWGNLGDGTNINRHTPVRVGTDNDWTMIALGNEYSAALKNDGSLWTWGHNEYGMLGDGTTINRLSPVQIGTDNNWATATTHNTSSYTMALKSNGNLCAWGRNHWGQLGDGTTTTQLTPMQIIFP
jgi:alpha-tubulin suppressor-like RCC1 family protein/subtilisin family serine protease